MARPATLRSLVREVRTLVDAEPGRLVEVTDDEFEHVLIFRDLCEALDAEGLELSDTATVEDVLDWVATNETALVERSRSAGARMVFGVWRKVKRGLGRMLKRGAQAVRKAGYARKKKPGRAMNTIRSLGQAALTVDRDADFGTRLHQLRAGYRANKAAARKHT